MSTQVARIGGQLLQENLQRELADLAFDTDLLVVKRDNTLGVATTTTPRNLTVNGTMRTTSGGSDPDIVFGNSLKVGDITLATSGISTPSGDVTLKSTHPQGYISTSGIGSYSFAVKGDGILALQTNGGIGFRPEVFDGQTVAWETDGNYGNYWSPGPINSASAPPNDMNRLYDYAVSLSQSGSWTSEELAALDYDGDGDIQIDDCLQLLNMNTQFVGGVAYPATRTLADHANTTAFKAYIEKYYPNSVPRKLQFDTGTTLTVTGDVHATGNITYGGDSITIGDDSTDSARFLSDFHNDIVPDLDNVYHIGKDDDSTGPAKGFKIAVQELKADTVKANGLVYQGIELTKDVGIYFVSNNNGSDTNDGNNPGGPFATLTKALSVAVDGDLIFMYPGTYQETYPMTVPAGVTIQGDSLRGVEIYPTSATQSNDAFLLNSGATIENITLKDHFYDSGNDKGYAFRLANNFNTGIINQEIGRSPYIRNVTVITKGSSTSASDPRGYASADAGRGALIDGSVAIQNSRSASVLFHAVTFITPGTTAITAKSGVRVEWLNSFIYFAETGIKLEQGTGRLQPDSTTAFGAEWRSIASANVYGNKGIVADGANCLAYLINHNFAYIGAGKDVTNDNTLTVQANEVTELNSAKIYFTSQDQRGNFRVGDKFLVDLENERTSFDVESIFADNTRVQIREGNNTLTLEPGQITLDNIVISGNVLEATRSDIALNSAGNIVFQGNVTAPNVTTSGNFVIDGAINTIGDAPTDTVDFNTPISQDFVPGTDAGALVLLGTISDPSFNYPKTYTLTANGITYTYNATGEDNRNYFVGIANLNVPGLTLSWHNENGLTNAIKITYVSQAQGDRLILADTNGWTWLGHTAGSYLAGAGDLGTSTARWKEVHTQSADVDSVRFSLANISSNQSDGNLTLQAQGSGKVKFDELNFKGATISNDTGDLTFAPTEDLQVDSTNNIKIPVGETAQRPATLAGIRYNTNISAFEGTSTAGAVSLQGIYDTDRDTYLNLSNNQFNFVTGGQTNHTLNGILLESGGFSSDHKFSIDGNVVSTDQQDGTFQLKSNGTGKTIIGDLQFATNDLFNNSNSNFIFNLTNTNSQAYLKFDNVNGIVPPQGNSSQRPTSPEVGNTRYNTELERVETWNGSNWVNSAGEVESILTGDVEELAYLFNLILD
tara:strand:- start:5955 stop:9488 length:3534 start_codon:yes stop_codon:yes gene_type:complete